MTFISHTMQERVTKTQMSCHIGHVSKPIASIVSTKKRKRRQKMPPACQMTMWWLLSKPKCLRACNLDLLARWEGEGSKKCRPTGEDQHLPLLLMFYRSAVHETNKVFPRHVHVWTRIVRVPGSTNWAPTRRTLWIKATLGMLRD